MYIADNHTTISIRAMLVYHKRPLILNELAVFFCLSLLVLQVVLRLSGDDIYHARERCAKCRLYFGRAECRRYDGIFRSPKFALGGSSAVSWLGA